MGVVLVALLGGVGAAARFLVDGLVRSRFPPTMLPVGTVTVNVTGSLILGFLVGAAAAGAVTDPVLAAAGTGFCGGYTTFSTAMVETVRLLQLGDPRRAVVNIVGTGVTTVLAASAGMAMAGLG